MKKTLLIALFSSALMAETIYMVKKGDNLSEILALVGVKSIYGENGSIEKAKKINKLRDTDLIFTGQILKLPDVEDDFNEYETAEGYKEYELVGYELVESEAIEPQPLHEQEAIRSFGANLSMGNFSFKSATSGSGSLVINGGSNKLELMSNSELGNLNHRLSLSGDLLVLAKDISFEINPKRILLMEYKFETIYSKDNYDLAGGAGLKDVMGAYSSYETGLRLTKSATPFVEIGGGLKNLPLNSKVDFRYRRFLGSETNRLKIKSGNSYGFKISKPLSGIGSSDLSGYIGYQKVITKTERTKDSETSSHIGVSIDW